MLQGDVMEKVVSEAVEEGVVTREQLQALGFAARYMSLDERMDVLFPECLV